MSCDRINWNSDPLVDEPTSEPRIEEEVLGLTLKEFGKGFLGVNHLIGKTLLNAFGAGAIVAPLENTMQSGGVLENWAARPSIVVDGADYVVIEREEGKPVLVRGVPRVSIFGGTRFAGTGYTPGEPLGKRFTFGVSDVPRVLVNDGKRETSYTKVRKILVLGGLEQAQPTAGVASIVNVNGEGNMTDEELLSAAVTEVQSPSPRQFVPPPPSVQEIDLQRSREYRLAKSRAADAQARLATAKAKTPYKPSMPSLSPVAAPDLTQYLRSENMSLDMEEILGEIDEVCGDDGTSTEIVGESWTEIVGDDYVLGSDVLVGAVAGVSRTPSKAALASAPKAQVKPASGAQQTTVKKPPTTAINAAVREGAKRVISKPLKRAVPGRGKSVLARIEDQGKVAMNRALQTGVNAQKRAKIALAAAQKATAVHGIDFEVLGAVAKTATTAKQKAAQAKAKRATERAKKVAEKLQKQGDKSVVASKKLAAVLQKVPPIRAKMKANLAQFGGKRTTVRGLEIEDNVDAQFTVGELYDVELPLVEYTVGGAAQGLGSRVSTMAQSMGLRRREGSHLHTAARSMGLARREGSHVHPDDQVHVLGAEPGDPNYDPRLDDPDYSGDYSPPADSGAPQSPAPTANPYAADPGATGALPGYVEETWTDIELPQRGQELSEDEAMTTYDSHSAVPPDAIYYHGERGLPADSLGSVSLMFDKTGLKDGFKFGMGRYRNQDADLANPDWVQRDALSVLKFETGITYPDGISDDLRRQRKGLNPMKFWTVFDEPNQIASSIPEAASQSQSRNTLILNKDGSKSEYNWGPFVGNPNGQLKGLQFDKELGAFFWQPDKAPRWSSDVAAIDNAIKEANKAGREAVAEANRTNKAIAEQEEAERQRLQAQSDFELSLQTDQAQTQSAIFSDQLAQQQQAAQAQQAAAMTALDLQAQKADLSWAAQQQSLEQRASQADLDWAIAHPDEAMAAQAQEEQYGDYSELPEGVDSEFAEAWQQSESDSGAAEAAELDQGAWE